MNARLRPLAVAASLVLVLATLALPAATGGATACADEGPRAGLVIDTGRRVIELCVQLDAAEVTGLRLIELAAAQQGLSYGFGLGGAAVCRLDGVGPAGDDCFAEYPEYWGYWHGDGRGGWTWASAGAGSYRVGDGDVEGWVWGSGDTGASHGEPPAVAFDEVCEPVAPPSPEPTKEPKPSPDPKPSPQPAASPSEAATGTSASPTRTKPDRSDDPKKDREETRTPSASTSPSPPSPSSSEAPAFAVGPPPGDGGPPAAMLVAVALGLLLGAGGWLRLRAKGTG